MPSLTSSGASTPNATSGIQTTEEGNRHIPSSTRPDGSTRKEIKIRPGYRPPEDVEKYKNRTAEAWKTRGKGGVPGAEALVADDNEGDKASNAGNKNAKRKEARKRAKEVERQDEVPVDERSDSIESTPHAKEQKAKGKRDPEKPPIETEVDPEAEREKQARNLKKKLRQARELSEKKDQGGNLLPEQFEKVIKINEIIRQLDSLGFDSDGAPKPKDTR